MAMMMKMPAKVKENLKKAIIPRMSKMMMPMMMAGIAASKQQVWATITLPFLSTILYFSYFEFVVVVFASGSVSFNANPTRRTPNP